MMFLKFRYRLVPFTVVASFSPFLQPIRDLAAETQRVAAGDYSQRVPVVQDDDLGALAASFNRMQAGLPERQRLQAAFGTYVDPALAARLLEQGDDVFTGERRQVTVMFVGIRLRLALVPTGDSADLIKTAAEFLYRIKAIPAATLPDGAVQPDTASTVLRDAGVNAAAGVGFVRAQ